MLNSNFTRQHHYKLSLKQESFSKKGFGVGFVSGGDRFTGIAEAKFKTAADLRQAQSVPSMATQDGSAGERVRG